MYYDVFMHVAPTLPVPLIKEMRFRHTGSKIRMTLKLMGRDGPRANARASYKRETKFKAHVDITGRLYNAYGILRMDEIQLHMICMLPNKSFTDHI